MGGFSDADVQLVTAAINDASGYCYADDSALWAPYVLRVLADAGRLTPDGRDVKVQQTWYRSLKPDGTVWCESSNAGEVIERSAGIAEKLERLVITQVIGSWEPWVEADGTP